METTTNTTEIANLILRATAPIATLPGATSMAGLEDDQAVQFEAGWDPAACHRAADNFDTDTPAESFLNGDGEVETKTPTGADQATYLWEQVSLASGCLATIQPLLVEAIQTEDWARALELAYDANAYLTGQQEGDRFTMDLPDGHPMELLLDELEARAGVARP